MVNDDPSLYAAHAERQAERMQRLRIISAFALCVALAGTLAVFIVLRVDQRRPYILAQDARAFQEGQIGALTKALEETKAENRRLVASLQRSGVPGSSISKEDQMLADLSKNDRDLSQRLSALEVAVVQSPEKAVSLPLLRQQLLDQQDRSKAEADGLQSEIARVYGLMEGFLALMVSLIVGVGTLALNSFRQVAK